MTIKRFSELKIIFSQCLWNGSGWSENDILDIIKSYLMDINGFDFKGLNINKVTGDRTSFTIAVIGAFFNLNSNVHKNDMIDLNDLMLYMTNKIDEFSCAEIRVEHTRHRAYQESNYPQLMKTS